jgi:hypothetical protein
MLARFVLVKKCFLLLILPMNVVRLGNVTSKYNHFRSLDAFDSVNIFLCDGTGYYVLYIFLLLSIYHKFYTTCYCSG